MSTQTTESPAPLTADSLNDIRTVLGTIHNAQKAILNQQSDILFSQADLKQRLEGFHERLDDIGAYMLRHANLSAFLGDVEGAFTALPAALRSLASDPVLGMMVGSHAVKIADEFEAFMAKRAAERASAPAIENTKP